MTIRDTLNVTEAIISEITKDIERVKVYSQDRPRDDEVDRQLKRFNEALRVAHTGFFNMCVAWLDEDREV